MSSWVKLSVVLIITFVFVYWLKNHSGYFPYSQNPMQYMPNMHRTNSVKPQRNYPFFKDGSGVRVPPEGTVARNIDYYPYSNETAAADVPATGNKFEVSMDNVKRGEKIFNTYCIVCHGPKGLGNGLVVPPYPKVPSLHSDKVRAFADSQIFHIISVGQNTMSAYGPQIEPDDRWKLVQYIRALQIAQNPSDEDLKAFENYKAN